MPSNVAALPALTWTGTTGEDSYDAASGALTITAAAGTDWTNDALGGAQQHRATALAFPVPDGDFTLSARVQVQGHRSTFDAAVLALWSDEDHWAKLCFEFSPQGAAMVVSVVTDHYSDDCNSLVVQEPYVHLRVARAGTAFVFHSSFDGVRWDFVRLFRLPQGRHPFQVGFMAQAPTAQTCSAVFDQIAFGPGAVDDQRNGA